MRRMDMKLLCPQRRLLYGLVWQILPVTDGVVMSAVSTVRRYTDMHDDDLETRTSPNRSRSMHGNVGPRVSHMSRSMCSCASASKVSAPILGSAHKRVCEPSWYVIMSDGTLQAVG